MEDPQDFPVAVHGPLTAGIIAWGHGVYTLENLLAAQSSAFEVESEGQKQVHLTLKITDRPALNLVLDPAKGYAVLSWSSDFNGRPAIIKRCEDYKLFSGRWIPAKISVERNDVMKAVPELLSYDHWEITSVSLAAPEAGCFQAPYDAEALIEFYSPLNEKPLFYRLSKKVDTDSLLQDRLAILADEPGRHNCATTALKYVASRLGRNISDEQLAGLLDEPEIGASLLELRELAKELGFHCRAIKTDL
ncbi:MAG: cysteine peptidase family C39 domain-containing protein, partial [Planctomycetota bacterium]